MAQLQPMIQSHHAGWQRLLAQQKKLDSDHSALNSKLEEATRAADSEEAMRIALTGRIDALMGQLHGFREFLDQVGAAGASLNIAHGAHDAHVPTGRPTPLSESSQVFGSPVAPATKHEVNVFEDAGADNDLFRDSPEVVTGAPPATGADVATVTTSATAGASAVTVATTAPAAASVDTSPLVLDATAAVVSTNSAASGPALATPPPAVVSDDASDLMAEGVPPVLEPVVKEKDGLPDFDDFEF